MGECFICPFSAERQFLSPGSEGCFFCEPCGLQLCQTQSPPFKCAVCRRDYTEWFVDTFCWLPLEFTSD